jgi:hypothetical protein
MPIRTLTASWTGPTGSATAVVTLDTELVNIAQDGAIPIDKLQDLTVTVQGARAGNGTYGKADFTELRFFAPFALDFSQPLVGQTGGSDQQIAFGTHDSEGKAGDFNLVSSGTGAAPDGVFPFAIATNGRNDPSDVLNLASINP